MKKVYVDGLGLVDGHFSGVGQYIYGILKGMDELIDEAKYAGKPYPRVDVIIPRDKVARFLSFGFTHIGYKKFPLPFRYMAALWSRDKMPPLDLLYGKAFYIFPRFVTMPLLFSKSAVVVYDLSFELYRQYSDEGNAIFLSRGVKRSIEKTQKVIAISKNARQELLDFYHLKPDQIVTATPATDRALFYRRSKKEIDRVKYKYGIQGDYILALSNLEPRKNLEALVDAYCDLPADLREGLSLLLVGVNGWKTDQLFNKIVEKVEAGYSIIRPSEYVSDEDKPAIISGARLLVYPSHYEGFGMPPLEALACGVPVITSDNSSLPEVVGGVGMMVPSTDTDRLKKEVQKTLRNIDTITKSALIAGPARAKEFSWKESAKVFFNVVEENS